MKQYIRATLATLFLTTNISYAQQHDHEHKHEHAEKKVNATTKSNETFKADEALNSRMQKIFALTANAKDTKLPATGAKITAIVQDIFKSCKLEPKADAAVHPILAELLAGAKQLEQGKTKEAQTKINLALDTYKKTFSKK